MAYYYFSTLVFDVDPVVLLGAMKDLLASEGIQLIPSQYRSQIGDQFFAMGQSPENERVLTIRTPSTLPLSMVHQAYCQFIREQSVVTLGLTYLESFWTATLSEGATILDRFSTLPHHLEFEPAEWQRLRGHPELVATKCDVPLEVILPYYRWWQTPHDAWSVASVKRTLLGQSRPMLGGKALKNDVYKYGQAAQVFDFAQRLGGCGHIDDGPEWSVFECVGTD